MRYTHIDRNDSLDRAVIAIGNNDPPGHLLTAHKHRRAPLLYGANGVIHVVTGTAIGWYHRSALSGSRQT